MTRKDYELIATALNDARAEAMRADSFEDRCEALQMASHYIADGMAADNPRFDRKRFAAACGFPA